jgi:hypothetical protein
VVFGFSVITAILHTERSTPKVGSVTIVALIAPAGPRKTTGRAGDFKGRRG